MNHLKQLESESIHIIRESVSVAKNPVMLFSMGKDSSVLLHLAKKAFYPSNIKFPLLHIDTGWKFKEMYDFRKSLQKNNDINFLTYKNKTQTNPFIDGSDYHTKIMKTVALKDALDKYLFDFILCGARRDEEPSRAKERIYSFRNKFHRWDYKNQRPEPWNYLNEFIKPKESVRVFPLSNWTELDIWRYIKQEELEVVPLYFAKTRPVVYKDGIYVLCEDKEVYKYIDKDKIIYKKVRFRTLGCYPLTGAIKSDAIDIDGIISEVLNSTTSERQNRIIDSDTSNMEDKKIDGYF